MERGGHGAPVQEGFRPLTTGVPPPRDGNFVLLVVPGVPLGVPLGVPPPHDGNFVLLVAPGVPPGVPPPHDGNFVLLVVPGRWELCGVFGIIKKIWFWFLSFLFFIFDSWFLSLV